MRKIALGIIAIASIVVACSSELETKKAQPAKSSDSPPAGTSPRREATAPPAPTPTPKPPPPPQAACSGAQGVEACVKCCDAKHPGGSQVMQKAMTTCMCTPAKCGTQCAQSACAATPAPPKPGDACATCIEKEAPDCEENAQDACTADANCKAFTGCIDTSKCEGEPDGGRPDAGHLDAGHMDAGH